MRPGDPRQAQGSPRLLIESRHERRKERQRNRQHPDHTQAVHPHPRRLGPRRLDLIWTISRDETVLSRGTVTAEGWIIVRVNPQTDGGTLWLRVGPRASGAQPAEVRGPDAEFAWCEKYALGSPPLVYTPYEWTMLALDRIGYHAGEGEPARRAAVIHFQREHDIRTTGTLDADTMKAIDDEMNRLVQESLAAQESGR